ncbi:MAG: class I SAM-dependent methyltransferase [Flavobacterium sp.]|nr:MAG: class I SAM-dependent methyltransferase [Flavobacterium sp.]
MDKNLLSPEIQEFIVSHSDGDIAALALRKNPFPDVDWREVVNQIAARAKSREKLPTWFNSELIYYPATISIEQASSEATARYKATIVDGNLLTDLTGGFGVDSYFFAQQISTVTHCEMNAELSAIAAHNFKVLGAQNISCLVGDGTQLLDKLPLQDWIYIDPARRSDSNRKVFMLEDCQPNVVQLLDNYFDKAKNILIKTSPVLDITAGLLALKNVKKIHVVAVKNEVKELLWELQRDYESNVTIKAINLTPTATEEFSFVFGDIASSTYSLPKKYLYEPNAAIMKSAGYEHISGQYNIEKLHPHSHLFSSAELQAFPGRRFMIDEIVAYDKAGIKRLSDLKKANITTRNFPETVERLRKRLKIADGGDRYCFFTTDINQDKIALICSKIMEA